MSEALQNLADNIRIQRKRNNLTQEGLAEKSTISLNTIQAIERCNGSPAWATIELLATTLKIKPQSLMLAPRVRE